MASVLLITGVMITALCLRVVLIRLVSTPEWLVLTRVTKCLSM